MASRERELFEAALAKPADSRDAFIADACQGDSALESRVRRLLAAHRRVPDTADWLPTGPIGAPPETVGPYRIVRGLGQGGMGTVYLAEQTQPMRRYVALKLIRQGLNTKEVVARFENERQAMALMNHPNIARILDGGATDDGHPYFVMEYVEGLPITEFCDQRRMPVAERLNLFVQVCHAVRHAHENGVLHRDIKPTNVLVADVHGTPFPKVIDFGIAKAMSDEMSHNPVHTTDGALIGTPAFMSPEQLDSVRELDSRSDVYSLGVILYELLTGVMPVELPGDAGIGIIVRVLQNHEPVPPSAAIRGSQDDDGNAADHRRTSDRELRRQLRGDIDAIVMKTLERNPALRYASVRELTDDLERFQAREPVRARRASTWYRGSRFVRRHRLGVTASAFVFLSLLFGLALAMWQARIASTERDRATAALGQAEDVSDFLIGLFEPSGQLSMTETAREVLQRGVRQAEQLYARPVAQAQMFQALGGAYRNLVQYDDAHEVLWRAYELRDSLFPQGHVDLARTLLALSVNYEARRLTDSAAFFADAALEMGRQLDSDGSFTAEALYARGVMALGHARFEQAEAYLLESADVWRRAAAPSDPAHAAPQLALGDVMRRTGNYEAASRFYTKATDHLTRAYGPDHLEVAVALLHHGDHILEDLHDAHRAIPMFERALRISEQRYGRDDSRVLHPINSLAFALVETGDFTSAEALVRRGVGIHLGQFGDQHIATARQREQLANIMVSAGKYEEAVRVYRDVIRVKLLTIGEATTWSTHKGLARALTGLERFVEAEVSAFEAWRLRVAEFGDDSPVLAESARDLGEVYLNWGRYEAAEQWFERALELGKLQGEDYPDVAAAYDALARTYDATGDAVKAAEYRQLAAKERSPDR